MSRQRIKPNKEKKTNHPDRDVFESIKTHPSNGGKKAKREEEEGTIKKKKIKKETEKFEMDLATAKTVASVVGAIAMRELSPAAVTWTAATVGNTVGGWLSPTSAPETLSIQQVKLRALELLPRTELEFLPFKLLDYQQSNRKTHARNKLMEAMMEVREKTMEVCWKIRQKIWSYQRPWFKQTWFGWRARLDVQSDLTQLALLRQRMDDLTEQDKKLPYANTLHSSGHFLETVASRDQTLTCFKEHGSGVEDHGEKEGIEAIPRHYPDSRDGKPIVEGCSIDFPTIEASAATQSEPKNRQLEHFVAKQPKKDPGQPQGELKAEPTGPHRNASLEEVLLDFSSI